MGYSVSRLTLYAVLSAIEEDLRKTIETHLATEGSVQWLLGDELFARSMDRLAKDRDIERVEPTINELLNYVDFADAFTMLNSHSQNLPKSLSKYIKEITPNLEILVPIRNRVAHTRPMNFDDYPKTLDIATSLLESSEDIWFALKSTFIRLNEEPSFVLGLKIPRYYSDKTNHNHNLPLPDFDETGFVGRTQQVKDLIKLCRGPYPVITIIGEGGVGKTALALKVAYEILDLPECPFEYVVWTSSKTMQLTAQEIVRIEGAITDSLGVLQDVAITLAGDSVKNSLDEILSYLAEFKILLVLDNLETVLDQRMRDFLEQLPAGSKVLITSRIGLGAFEFPVKLKSMDEMDAIRLLRASAKIRGVSELTQMSNDQLQKYCSKMEYSPGYIKWFVLAVQAGRRPEEVLDKPELFLEFCMSNVYEKLSTDSRGVLDALLIVPGEHSQAELAYLLDMDVIDLQKSLQELLTTNMVLMSSLPTGSSFTSKYILADLPRQYLSKHHSPSTSDYTEISKRKKRLVAESERAKTDQQSRPYFPYNIRIRSQSDLVVAKHLKSALWYAKDGLFEQAEKEVSIARSLDPGFFEVHRVEAWIKVNQRNIPAARNAYDVAIELEPQYAPLLAWHGNFLQKYLDDSEGALRRFKEAEQIDPQAYDVQLGIARASLYLMQFTEAQAALDTLIAIKDVLSDSELVKVYDLYLQIYQRQAEYQVTLHRYNDAVIVLENLRKIFESCPSRLLDDEMKEKLSKARYWGQCCVDEIDEVALKGRAISISDWLSLDWYRGVIVRLPVGEPFGFIRLVDGRELFFHRNDLRNRWSEIRVNNEVQFSIGSNDKGPCAIHVYLVNHGI